MIELRNVQKRYKGKKVVRDVDLFIPKGARVGLVGPNGAGKSTLMKMIATLVNPSRGDVLIEGKSFRFKKKAIRKRIGYVPQDIALHSNLTVKDNLKFWAGMAPGKIPNERVDQLLDMVGLTPHVKKRVEKLSGGMQRKLNILIALLHNPDYLIMDEPTVGIDISSKTDIIRFLHHLNPDKTVLFSSHDLQEIEDLCQFVLVLEEGTLRHFGPIQELHGMNPVHYLLRDLNIIRR
ncbi:ABC transporter ATP-binding protein [Alkalihalobacillus sp. AL-G]|uniref:ABC transporter ATP-binding protein n=1 Tax=Alkalihalobacillus sp. AL-G TaxID=2926399 RepID=UPI00272C531D|nr:ABC transporter ATP-binding protein [Alkalihalobacillus sp. AL-G]WLD93043.1 ABC transporter ATP-binding protein [Alkalihalobacillus sp. AL-G]